MEKEHKMPQSQSGIKVVHKQVTKTIKIEF